MYMWDILMFWKCTTFHSMYNILFQYACDIYWCCETVPHVTPRTIFNCDVSRPHTTTLSITMLSDSHVPYNQYIHLYNVYISCKINSCLLPHWCVLTFIKIIFSEKCLENLDKSTKVTSVSFKQLVTLYMYSCAFTWDVLLLCTFCDITTCNI